MKKIKSESGLEFKLYKNGGIKVFHKGLLCAYYPSKDVCAIKSLLGINDELKAKMV